MKKKLLLSLLGVALLSGVAFAYAKLSDDEPRPPESPTAAEIDQLTAEDATTDSEKDLEEQPTSPPSNPPADPAPSDKQLVSVSITQAGPDSDLVVVRAFADVFADGSCTAVFTKSGQPAKTYTEETEQQAQYTQCNPFQIPRSEFASGTWKVVVTFESAAHRGSAENEFSL